jgi:hypothetical protein
LLTFLVIEKDGYLRIAEDLTDRGLNSVHDLSVSLSLGNVCSHENAILNFFSLFFAL